MSEHKVFELARAYAKAKFANDQAVQDWEHRKLGPVTRETWARDTLLHKAMTSTREEMERAHTALLDACKEGDGIMDNISALACAIEKLPVIVPTDDRRLVYTGRTMRGGNRAYEQESKLLAALGTEGMTMGELVQAMRPLYAQYVKRPLPAIRRSVIGLIKDQFIEVV